MWKVSYHFELVFSIGMVQDCTVMVWEWYRNGRYGKDNKIPMAGV